MATLTPAQRKQLPKSAYALPGKKMFPMPDKSHAMAAERLVGRAVKAGSVSQAEAAHVKAMAHGKLNSKAMLQRMKERTHGK